MIRAVGLGLLLLAVVGSAATGGEGRAPGSLGGRGDLRRLRGLTAEWTEGGGEARWHLASTARDARGVGYAWAEFGPDQGSWDLGGRATVEALVANRGTVAAAVMLWVVGGPGWDASGDFATLAPGEERRFSCRLRATFPDGTPKLDPTRVGGVRVMVAKGVAGLTLEVGGLRARGDAPPWVRPPGRLEVPAVEDGPPAPGRRVRYWPADVAGALPPALLYLPPEWQPRGSYPVIVEYPGNIFFRDSSYSTGDPAQAVIGYGMSEGRGSIWLCLPFVEPGRLQAIEDGWGNPDATADYAVRVVEDVVARWGGDRSNIVLTGFSRGALACGFIGLRNERIAGLWKAFHACQHYDGDGWKGASMAGALERARRFRGVAVFQTDNPEAPFRAVMDAMRVPITWADSGLGFHASAMFLDDRPSTRQLRVWYRDLGLER